MTKHQHGSVTSIMIYCPVLCIMNLFIE